MAVHPKIGIFGVVLGMAVAIGMALFLLGRLTSGGNLTELLIGVGVGIGILGVVVLALLRHLPSSSRMEGMLLPHTQASDEGYVSALPRQDLVGKNGIAAGELRPAGTVIIDGERIDVITEGDWMPSGTPVVVVKAEAMRLVVRRAPQLNA